MPRTTRKTTESSRVRLFVNFRPKAQTSIKISRQDLVDLYGDGHAKSLTTRTSFDELLSVITEYVHEKNKEDGHFLEGYTFRQLAFPQVIFGRSEKYTKKEKSKDIQKLVSITSVADTCLTFLREGFNEFSERTKQHGSPNRRRRILSRSSENWETHTSFSYSLCLARLGQEMNHQPSAAADAQVPSSHSQFALAHWRQERWPPLLAA